MSAIGTRQLIGAPLVEFARPAQHGAWPTSWPLSNYSSLTPLQYASYIRRSSADRPPADGRSPDASPPGAARVAMPTLGTGRAGGGKHAGPAHQLTAGVNKARD